MDRTEAIRAVRKAGVVGAATGIPLAVKLTDPSPVLLVNAVEGEPTYTVSTLLMDRSSRELSDTMRRFSDMGYRRVVLAVNDWTIDESDALIDRASEGGFEVAEVPGEVMGLTEAEIVGAALHRIVEDVAAAGVTILSLETLWHAHRAIFKGKPQTTKLVQMAGELETALVYEAPIGTLARDLAAIAGVPTEMKAVAVSAADRLKGLRGVPPDAGPAISKATDTVVIVDPDYPPAYALETIGPAKGIEGIENRVQRVHVPLGTYAGRRPKATVRTGERVRKGQILAAFDGPEGVDAHAPFDGTVVGVAADAVDVER